LFLAEDDWEFALISLFFLKSGLYEQVEAFNQTSQQNMDKACIPLQD